MTYGELSRIRGIGRESAVKLAQRKRWRRIPGNDGIARVFVPLDWLTPAKEDSGEHSPHHSPASSPERSSAINSLEATLAALKEQQEHERAGLREQIDKERTRADRAEQRAAAAEASAAHDRQDFLDAEGRITRELEATRKRAEQAEQGREGERTRAEALRDRLETLQAQLAEAEAEGAASNVQVAELTAQLRQTRHEAQEAAEVETERRARGRWARLRAAWRGE